MAKCMAPLCHMGRWNECEGDTWKPCVTKMENGKKKKRILSNGKCDQFVEENKIKKEKKGRKKRRNSLWKGRKERKERKLRKGKERKGRGGEREEDQLLSLHFSVFGGPRSRHCSRSKR